MAKISTTRNYADAKTPTASMFDDFVDDIETFLNSTKTNSDNLQSGGVTTAKLKSESITSTNLDEDSITAVKVLDASATISKFETPTITTDGTDPGKGGFCFSASSSTYSMSSTSEAAITNLSCILTTGGRPIFLGLLSKGGTSGYAGYIGLVPPTSETAEPTDGEIRIYRDASQIAEFYYKIAGGNTEGRGGESPYFFFPNMPITIDEVAAGTYTYTAKARVADDDGTLRVYNLKMVAFEL